MRNPKKILVALVVLLALGATMPVFAELNGHWAGTGRGVCYPPFPTPTPHPIYAWQHWSGRVEDSRDFYGRWEDEEGNYGKFKGEIILMSPTTAYCRGEWTWFNTFVDPPREIVMGKFDMSFNYVEEVCEGRWWTPDGAVPGSMRGERIGE
jgi:hypothetical protein